MLSVRILAALVAGALMIDEAAAQGPGNPPPIDATPQAPPPLPPAGPAPRQQAQNVGRPLLYWGLGGAAIVAGVILLSQDNDGSPAVVTTTGTK